MQIKDAAAASRSHRRIAVTRLSGLLVIGVAAILVTGCTVGGPGSAAPQAGGNKAVVQLSMSPACACCGEYVDHLEADGYRVEVTHTDDMRKVKEAHRVPAELQSCHTAVVGGYFVEGHVPAASIDKLLRERPEIDGIALPGMPPGSPGMGGEQQSAFTIHSVVNGESTGVQ